MPKTDRTFSAFDRYPPSPRLPGMPPVPLPEPWAPSKPAPEPAPLRPSRRGVLASAAGLLALGTVHQAGAEIVHRDAELIATCDRIVATEAERERLESPYYETWGPPEHVSERTRAVVAEGHRLAEAVAGMPAATMEGLRAKARAMLSYVCFTVGGEPDWSNHDELLGWSIARDLLGGA